MQNFGCSLDIWHMALYSCPLHRFCKLCPWIQNLPPPHGSHILHDSVFILVWFCIYIQDLQWLRCAIYRATWPSFYMLFSVDHSDAVKQLLLCFCCSINISSISWVIVSFTGSCKTARWSRLHRIKSHHPAEPRRLDRLQPQCDFDWQGHEGQLSVLRPPCVTRSTSSGKNNRQHFSSVLFSRWVEL